MKSESLALVCILAIAFAAFAPNCAFSADQRAIDDLLLEALKAERTGGSSPKVAEKFQVVLKADPTNYYALIKLGLMKMQEAKAAKGAAKGAEADAIEYFLRATIARPNHPEAYLYLADMNYHLGYVTEGDAFLRMAGGAQRNEIYDGVYLLAKRYEDSGNQYAAICLYSDGAFSSESRFRNDPYFVRRMYDAIRASGRPYEWVYPVANQLIGEKATATVTSELRRLVNEEFGMYPALDQHFNRAEVVSAIMRSLILSHMRSEYPRIEEFPVSHELPTAMYKLFFCNPEEIPPRQVTDPWEAFVKASFDTPEEQQQTLNQLHSLRTEALRVIADEKDEMEKARKLFAWLKKRAMAEYHALDGYSARGLVDDKKFLCLSGAILYTLIGRDAKLDVNGFLVPGHAYAVFNHDHKIRVETTAEGPEGFDYKPDPAVKTHERDRVLVRGPYEIQGEVTDPLQFVAYQFSNAAALSVHTLVLTKYEQLFRQTLKKELDVDEARQTEMINGLRAYGVTGQNAVVFKRLVNKMAATDNNFREDLIKQLDKGMELLKTARSLSPFDVGFRDRIYTGIRGVALLEAMPAMTAADERKEKRAKLTARKIQLEQQGISLTEAGVKKTEAEKTGAEMAQIEQELAQIDAEEKAAWDNEKKLYLLALKRLARAARDFSCEASMRATLASYHEVLIALGEKQRDGAFLDEVKTSTVGLVQ